MLSKLIDSGRLKTILVLPLLSLPPLLSVARRSPRSLAAAPYFWQAWLGQPNLAHSPIGCPHTWLVNQMPTEPSNRNTYSFSRNPSRREHVRVALALHVIRRVALGLLPAVEAVPHLFQSPRVAAFEYSVARVSKKLACSTPLSSGASQGSGCSSTM